jgi:hypothetical protein
MILLSEHHLTALASTTGPTLLQRLQLLACVVADQAALTRKLIPQEHRMQVSLHANMLDDWAVGVALMRLDMAMVIAKSPFSQHTHCRTVNVHDIIHGSAHLGPTCITSRQGSRGR